MLLQLDSLESIQVSSIQQFDATWQDILQSLTTQRRVISQVLINNESSDADFLLYINNYFSDIKTISIETSSEQEMLDSTVEEIFRYSEAVVVSCDAIGANFYSEMQEKQWNEFNQLLEGLSWLYEASVRSSEYMAASNHTDLMLMKKLSLLATTIAEVLKELEQSLEQNDYTAAGDIIKYELKERFEQL